MERVVSQICMVGVLTKKNPDLFNQDVFCQNKFYVFLSYDKIRFSGILFILL